MLELKPFEEMTEEELEEFEESIVDSCFAQLDYE